MFEEVSCPRGLRGKTGICLEIFLYLDISWPLSMTV